MGRMFLTMTAAFAELERNLIAERTEAALQYKKSKRQVYGRSVWLLVVRRCAQGNRDGI